MRPGEVPLGELARRNRLSVRGTVIELPSLAGATAEQVEAGGELLEGLKRGGDFKAVLHRCQSDKTWMASALEGTLAEHDPATDELGAAIFQRLARQSRQHAAIKNSLEAFVPRLMDLPAQALAKGTFAEERGQSLMGMVRDVAESFPEVASREYLDTHLAPVIASGDSMASEVALLIARDWWESRPDLVQPSVEMVFSAAQDGPISCGGRVLLEQAREQHG